MRSMCVGVAETGVKAFLFLTFAALFVSEKREKKKSYFKYLQGRTMFAPTMEFKVQHVAKRKNQMLFSLFLLHMPPQKKRYQKENAEWRFRALRSATKAPRF